MSKDRLYRFLGSKSAHLFTKSQYEYLGDKYMYRNYDTIFVKKNNNKNPLGQRHNGLDLLKLQCLS